MKKKITVMLATLFLGGISVMNPAQIVCAGTLSQQDNANTADKEPQTAAEKRKAMLTPEFYTKFLGAYFFTISTIEKEFEVNPVRIVGLTFFYDFGTCFVGMEANKEGVVTQMTLRLYADKAVEFIQKAIDYGYKYISDGKEVNVRTESDILSDVYASKVKRYRKKTEHGNVYLEVSTNKENVNEYAIAIYRSAK